MTGNDEDMADILEEDLQDYGVDVETSDVGFTDASDYLDSDLCIFITYTYGEGVMTDEIADFYDELKKLDLTDKYFAVMGSGDKTYGKHFCENVFDFEKAFKACHATEITKPVTIENAPDDDAIDLIDQAAKEMADKLMTKNKKEVTIGDQAQIRKLGQKLIKRHRNLWVYTIFGFVAALINTVVFMVLHSWWHNVMVISNTIAFIISNLASFYFNQKAVFINNVDHEHSTWHKLIVFFTYRVISLIPDTLIMLVGLSWLHLNALFVKIIDQVLVGIFNYLTTRSVFQKQEHTMIERAKRRIQEQKAKKKQ